MEKQEDSFIISPTNIILQSHEETIKFSVKNTGLRSTRYEIFINDIDHFKILNSRTFHLAPGITKHLKIHHIPSQKCSSQAQIIQVVDANNYRQFVHLRCFQQQVHQQKRLEIDHEINLQKIKTNEEKQLDIVFRNVGKQNLKLKVRHAMQRDLEEKIQFKVLDEQMVVLRDACKKVRASIKLLKQVDFQIQVILEFTEENSRERWKEIVKITGNSLIRSQFIADANLNRIDSVNHELLNGTTTSGTIFLVNNYHKSCQFKLLELIEIVDYKSYCERLEEISVKLDIKEGFVSQKNQQKVNYVLSTNPNDNDKSFTYRYSQLSIKDEANSYKLRNSNFFRKNLEIIIKVQFGDDNPTTFKLKAHIINPALKISKISSGNCDAFEILNDSCIQVPFKFNTNIFYAAKVPKGKLKQGMNQIEIQWRKQANANAKSKQNMEGYLKCAVKMEIPKNQVILYEPSILQRPKTAMIRSGSVSRDNLRQRVCLRAPSKAGSYGVKNLKEITHEDFMPQPYRYSKGQLFADDQFKFLQINQNQKGNVITNSHKNKNIIIYFTDKGYLFLESQHSYLLPYERRSLRFQFSGRAFEVKSHEVQDKQPYKITTKQLQFSFSAGQKEFQVVRQVQIHNRSNEFIMMYCLSVDDDYFHSLQEDNKIIIAPKSTNNFKICFFPKAEFRLKENKIIRNIQFLINNQKESIICEGDLLTADIDIEEKKLVFTNCRYSPQEITKKITIMNRGLNKVSYQINHSDNIKIIPKSYFINEKNKQIITLSFSPAKLLKEYNQNIIIYFKGSHAIIIPLTITTLEPEIQCMESVINFKQGYLTQTLNAAININNRNGYECKFNINYQGTQLKSQKNVIIGAGQTKRIDFDLLIADVGEKIIKLPSNFIELCGYGALKGPTQYRYIGKKTLLQLIPDNPFSNLIFSQIQETKSFKIKNLSQDVQYIDLILTPQQGCENHEENIILSCQPTTADIYPGEQKDFKLLSIRGDSQYLKNQSKFFKYNLSLNMKQNKKYRKFDFAVEVPAPQLQITPKQVYFPLTSTGTWSKSSFKILNKGYKEVLVAIKKPVNIAFQFDFKTENQSNRLTKLNNLMEVSVFYKSKKSASFSVNLDIEDNFGKKYQVKLFGTSSNSPLLNCQRTISSSSKGFSNKQIRSTNSPSLLSSSNLTQCSQQLQNVRFLNKWFSSFLPDFSKENQSFNNWLKVPRNFMQLLRYFKLDISFKEDSIDSIMQQLKKCGFPVYTVKVKELAQGSLEQWSMCLWYLLSKELIHDDTLKWVNKMCGISLQTYENAFCHQKKIFNDLLSKVFEPIFKGKITDLQKILEYLEPSLPILAKIQNKKQFMIAINILYNKFSKVQKEKVLISNMEYDLKLGSKTKSKKHYCILGNSSFEATIGPNSFNSKHTSQKKLLSFIAEGEDNVSIKVKDDLNVAVWNNTLHEPLKIYELQINKKAPHIHNICIECQNKCSQQWKLLFPCEVESQYFFEFSGGMEFKCKMPDLGIIKSGEVMEFIIIYSPTNLKQHSGVLKISNKYEEHIYNLRGKSLRSNYVQIERFIHIPQGEKHQQTLSVIQDSDVCLQTSIYKVNILGQPCEELKSIQAKSNKIQIIIQVVMEFTKVIQDKQVFLQVYNEEMTFCKNIRLVINVIPKPIIVQARLKGIIDKTTIQKIPLTNSLPSKQNCFVSLRKITKDEYDNFNRYHLQRQQSSRQIQNGDGQFKLSQVGKIVLKSKEKVNVNLSFLPNTLTQSYCQIRIKMQGTESIIVYNFLGVPQLPCTDNPPIILKCQAQQQTIQTIKVPNRLRQKVLFDIQTNISFIAGAQQITVNSRQTFAYSFKLLPLHAGTFQGEIIFKNQKFYLVYPLKITVVSKKKIRKIRVQSKIRVTSKIQIQLSNKSDRDIQYEVFCKSEYLKVEPTFLLPANSEKALILNYTPLFVGTKTAELKLYHQTMQQINYNLEIISEDHKQNLKFNCQLGEKKKIKIPIKNPTSQVAQLQQPKLPKQLSCHLGGNQHFPLSVPAYGVIFLQMLFTQYSMEKQYKYSIQLPTNQIGNFNFDLLFVNDPNKKMQETIIHYLDSDKKETIKKQLCFDLLNYFDQMLQFQIPNPKMEINQSTKLAIEGPYKFFLKGYEKRRIRCEITIIDDKKSTKMIPDNSSGRSHQLQPKCNEIILQSNGFKWIFPVQVVKIYEIKNPLEIIGSSQELAKARISLKYIKGIKNWVISDCPNYRQNFNLSFISSREVYLQTIFNKPYQYNGSVMFYDEDMSCAEKYTLCVKIGEKKFEKVWITANVGDKGKVEIRLKNGKGHYKVEIKNNKMKEFGVFPMQGQFKEKGQNIIYFEYAPIQYNGNKKAEVFITSDYGSFNFYLMGKFPPLK